MLLVCASNQVSLPVVKFIGATPFKINRLPSCLINWAGLNGYLDCRREAMIWLDGLLVILATNMSPAVGLTAVKVKSTTENAHG